MREAESQFQGGYTGTILDTLKQAYRGSTGRLALWLTVGFAGRVILLGNVNLIGYWVDSYCHAPLQCRPQPAWLAGYGPHQFVLALGAATLAGFVLTALYRVGFSRLSAQAVSRIYDETTLRVSRLPMSFFDSNPAGRVITRFSSDYNNVFRIFGGPLAEFLSLIFDLVAMSLLMGLASAWNILFWILVGALNFCVYRANLDRVRKERRELARTRSPSIAHFAETAQGAATIRAYGREPAFLSRFLGLHGTLIRQRVRTQTALSLFSLGMGSLTAVVFLAAGLLATWLVGTGRVSVGSLGVAFSFIGLSANVLQSFFEWLAQMEEALAGLERLDQYLRLPLEAGAVLPQSARFETGQARTAAEFKAAAHPPAMEVEIDDLWFRYRPELGPVLRGLTVRIRAGEKFAIVGATGSGKTSLVQALFRLYPIERGSIRIGGFEAATDDAPEPHPGQRIPLEDYRRQIAWIPQEPTLWSGPLRDNLVPGRDFHSDEELLRALRQVAFPGASPGANYDVGILDRPIEERGRNLSAGERQLLCMARCLLQNAPVVILDEATSSVDPRSEDILSRAADEFFAGKTRIIIAHRLSTIRDCDRVLWLGAGQALRIGHPDDVLAEFESAARAQEL